MTRVSDFVNEKRLWDRHMAIAEHGKTGNGGVNRQALTDHDRAARAQLDQAGAAIGEARAAIAEASAAQNTARQQLGLYRDLGDPAAVSRAEVIRAEGEEAAATSRLGLARALGLRRCRRHCWLADVIIREVL